MLLLILFSFIAGIVTVLSPCILPVLPIVLSSSVGDKTDHKRPYGIVLGFILSFTFFTLFLSTIVQLTGLSADFLRLLSVFVIAFFGLTLLVPSFEKLFEKLFNQLARFTPNTQNKSGFTGGIIIGLSLGLLWTPCVGPILASVISLAITGTVTFAAFVLVFAYSIGTAIPMFAIMKSGQKLLQNSPVLTKNLDKIRKGFGILMLLTALAIFTNFDRKFQTFVLQTFPKYGTGLTKFEENDLIKDQLKNLNDPESPAVTEDDMGKPTYNINERKGPMAPELIQGGQWFNSEPLTLKDLRGKVVLIDFWTYSCINCQRTFPYLRSWWEKYQNDGLVIIGVHAPEFEFEKDPDNLAKAIESFQLTYPIMQDNQFNTWQAYKNRYWPAKYLIDKDGFIRYTHFGEGKYDETEDQIQALLTETNHVEYGRNDNPTYEIYSKTPETYLGYKRMQNFSSNESIVKDQPATYTTPDNLMMDNFAFEGEWLSTEEYSQPSPGSSLSLNFDSKEVYLVMNPTDGPVKVKVLVDGEIQYPGSSVEDGYLTVDSDNLYHLVSLPEPGQHTLTLEFPSGQVQVFAFTFG